MGQRSECWNWLEQVVTASAAEGMRYCSGQGRPEKVEVDMHSCSQLGIQWWVEEGSSALGSPESQEEVGTRGLAAA